MFKSFEDTKNLIESDQSSGNKSEGFKVNNIDEESPNLEVEKYMEEGLRDSHNSSEKMERGKSDLRDDMGQTDSSGEGGSIDSGLVTNEEELLKNIKNKLSKIIEEKLSLDDSDTVEVVAESTLEGFKNKMRERLASMGIDKYKESASKAGRFIRNICVDYYKNTSKILKFGLVVKRDEVGEPEKVSLEANDFIDSVDLNNVIARVNNRDKDMEQSNKIDLSEYLEVVEMDAMSAMDELKKMRTSLTPDVSRWFGAVQRMVGMPNKEEPFRNYLQRSMNQKYEVDGNLNHPENENIENALQEVVPMLYKGILLKRSEQGESDKKVQINNEKVQINNERFDKSSRVNRSEQVDRVEQISKNNFVKEKQANESMKLNQVVALINKGEKERGQISKIDLSEYMEVVDMNALMALGKLKKLGSSLGFNVRNWLETTRTVLGDPEDVESLGDYLQRALSINNKINDRLGNIDRENIKEVLKAIVPVLHKVVLLDRMGK